MVRRRQRGSRVRHRAARGRPRAGAAVWAQDPRRPGALVERRRGRQRGPASGAAGQARRVTAALQRVEQRKERYTCQGGRSGSTRLCFPSCVTFAGDLVASVIERLCTCRAQTPAVRQASAEEVPSKSTGELLSWLETYTGRQPRQTFFGWYHIHTHVSPQLLVGIGRVCTILADQSAQRLTCLPLRRIVSCAYGASCKSNANKFF